MVEGFHSIPWMALIPFVAHYQNLLLFDSPNVFLESPPAGTVSSFPLHCPWPLVLTPLFLPLPVCSLLVAFSAVLLIIGVQNTPQIWHRSWISLQHLTSSFPTYLQLLVKLNPIDSILIVAAPCYIILYRMCRRFKTTESEKSLASYVFSKKKQNTSLIAAFIWERLRSVGKMGRRF